MGDGHIPVVSASNNTGKKKSGMETWIIAVIAIAVVAVIITAVAIKRGKTDKSEVPETTAEEALTDLILNSGAGKDEAITFSEDVSVSFEGISVDYADRLLEHEMNTSVTEAIKAPASTTVKSVPPKQKVEKPKVSASKYHESTTVLTNEPADGSDEIINVIRAFFDGRYYIDGKMISGGSETLMELAMDGENFQVFSEMDGKDIAVIMMDEKMYMLNPDTKRYAELTAAFQKMVGIDASSLKFEFTNTGLDGSSPTSVTKAEYNGNDADCYTYENETIKIEFIAADGEIKQMSVYNSDGAVKSVFIADEFSADIPDEMLNFKGYSKQNMLSFMADLM